MKPEHTGFNSLSLHHAFTTWSRFHVIHPSANINHQAGPWDGSTLVTSPSTTHIHICSVLKRAISPHTLQFHSNTALRRYCETNFRIMHLSIINPNPYYHNIQLVRLLQVKMPRRNYKLKHIFTYKTETHIHIQKPFEKQDGRFWNQFHDDAVPKRMCY
jgi:hypothetical protein